jgi:hypothetical protein
MNRYFAKCFSDISTDAECDHHVARVEQGNDKVGL